MWTGPHYWSALCFLTAIVAFSAVVTSASGWPQRASARGSTAQYQNQMESESLGPDLPLSSVPSGAVGVRFVVEHRSALNGRTVRVRGVVAAALLGNAACPPNRGMCMPPSVVLAESESCKNQSACSVRVVLHKQTKQQDYLVGRAAEVLATVDGHMTGVTLSKVD